MNSNYHISIPNTPYVKFSLFFFCDFVWFGFEQNKMNRGIKLWKIFKETKKILQKDIRFFFRLRIPTNILLSNK